MEQNNFDTQMSDAQQTGASAPLPRHMILPRLEFVEAVKICLKKYFDFTGRARRSEYWWFFLFGMIVSAVGSFLDGITSIFYTTSIFSIILELAFLIPNLSVTWRRLHDVGRSGWWVVVSYILMLLAGIVFVVVASPDVVFNMVEDPKAFVNAFSLQGWTFYVPLIASLIVGCIVFVFTLLDSHWGENKYGPSPKYP